MPLAQHHMFPPASTLAIPGPLSFLPESPKCRILSFMGTLHLTTPAMAAPSPKSLVFSPPNLVRVFPQGKSTPDTRVSGARIPVFTI